MNRLRGIFCMLSTLAWFSVGANMSLRAQESAEQGKPAAEAGAMLPQRQPAAETIVPQREREAETIVPPSQPITGLSLRQCLDMAEENSAALKNARLDVWAARAKKSEVFTNYFPKVSASAFLFYAFSPMLDLGIRDIVGTSVFTRELENRLEQLGNEYGFNTRYRGIEQGITASVSAVQPVFAGGRIVTGNRLAQLGVQASTLQEQIKRRELLEEVESNYWLIISLSEKIKTLDRADELLSNIEKTVDAARKAGLATESDLMQVHLRQDEMRSSRIQVENGIRLSKMNLFNIIGFAYNPYRNVNFDSLPRLDDVVLSDSMGLLLPPETYYVSEDEIAAMQEEIRLLDLQVDAERLQKRLIMGEALPQIGVGAGYGYSDIITKGSFNGAVFATVKIPLSDWGATAHKMRGEEYKLQKARNDRDFYSEQVLLQIRQMWLNLTSAWDQLLVAEQSVRTAEKTASQLNEHYKAGMCSLSELLQAQTDLRRTADACTDRKIAYRTSLQSYLRRIATE